MTGTLGTADMARLERLGLGAIAPELGLRLFDEAVADGGAALVPAPVDTVALRAQAHLAGVPALLRGLVPASKRKREGGSLSQQLGQLPEAEWDEAVLGVVRGQVAAVLGHAEPASSTST